MPPPAALAPPSPALRSTVYPPEPPEMLAEEWSPCTGVRMTAAEFVRLPADDSLTRWLIDGVVWEEPMTVRSVPHSISENRIGFELRTWLRGHLPDGEVASGEAAVLLPGRETVVGVDVAVFDPETVAAQPPPPAEGEGMHVWHGVPRLAVEVMSPSDRYGTVDVKVRTYLEAGVLAVWIADPVLKALTIFRPDGPARTYQGDDAVPGGGVLPGLDVRAGDLFGRG